MPSQMLLMEVLNFKILRRSMSLLPMLLRPPLMWLVLATLPFKHGTPHTKVHCTGAQAWGYHASGGGVYTGHTVFRSSEDVPISKPLAHRIVGSAFCGHGAVSAGGTGCVLCQLLTAVQCNGAQLR